MTSTPTYRVKARKFGTKAWTTLIGPPMGKGDAEGAVNELQLLGWETKVVRYNAPPVTTPDVPCCQYDCEGHGVSCVRQTRYIPEHLR